MLGSFGPLDGLRMAETTAQVTVAVITALELTVSGTVRDKVRRDVHFGYFYWPDPHTSELLNS